MFDDVCLVWLEAILSLKLLTDSLQVSINANTFHCAVEFYSEDVSRKTL